MTIAQSHPQNNVGLDLSKLSVLVVDSDGYAVETVNQIMRGFGLKNQASAENGEAAKARLNQKAIDLFIVEAVLPDMLGAELVKWIRRHQDLMVRQSSIIVLTGHTVVKYRECARLRRQYRPEEAGRRHHTVRPDRLVRGDAPVFYRNRHLCRAGPPVPATGTAGRHRAQKHGSAGGDRGGVRTQSAAKRDRFPSSNPSRSNWINSHGHGKNRDWP